MRSDTMLRCVIWFCYILIAVNEKNNLQDENKKIAEQFQQLQKELE